MATSDEIATLQRATALAPGDATYSDQFLSDLIDTMGIQAAAAQIWREKAAGYAAAIDITESGSSRKFSTLQGQALKMAALYTAEEVVNLPSTSGVVQIERP